jgi:hypothetical protein
MLIPSIYAKQMTLQKRAWKRRFQALWALLFTLQKTVVAVAELRPSSRPLLVAIKVALPTGEKAALACLCARRDLLLSNWKSYATATVYFWRAVTANSMVWWAPARPWVPTWHILQLLLIVSFTLVSWLHTRSFLSEGLFLFPVCPRPADRVAVAGGRELAARGTNSVTNVLVLPPEALPTLPYQMAASGGGHPVKNLAGPQCRTSLLPVAQLTYFTHTPFSKPKGFSTTSRPN